MTNAQLEQIVLVQARELAAQRKTIEALKRRVASHAPHESDRKAYRRGYKAGWAKRKRTDG